LIDRLFLTTIWLLSVLPAQSQTLLPFSAGSPAAAPSSPIPAANNVSTNWQKAGLAVIGGYPTRNTQCGSTVAAVGGTPPFTNDDYQNITAAIAACTAGDFVLLGIGTFNFAMSELPLLLNKGITLRGSGNCSQAGSSTAAYCQTSIVVNNGALNTYQGGGQCGVNSSSIVTCNAANAVIYMSPTGNFDYGWNACGHSNPCNSGVPLAADAAQGATTVQVTQTSSFSVGQWVLIDESIGANYQADPITAYNQIWAAADFLSGSSSPATAKIAPGKHSPSIAIDNFSINQFPYNTIGGISCGYGIECDRGNGEMHLISSIGAGPCPGTNCTLTFDSPLTIAFRISGGAQGCQGYISSGSGSSSPGNTLTITTGCTSGALAINQPLWYSGITGSTAIWYITAGSGSSWTVSNAQNGGSSGTGSIGSSASPVTFNGAGYNAQISYIANQSGTKTAPLQQAGVENLSIGRGDNGGIATQFCIYCWVKNVDVWGWIGGAVNIYDSARFQTDFSFLHDCYDCENNGAEYAYSCNAACTETLFVNSIISNSGKSMVGRASGGGNVVAYNVCDDTFYMYTVIGNWFLDHDCNGSHYFGAHHWLFEGNYAATCGDDDTHGNILYHTYFRNWCRGYRTPFSDPSLIAAGMSGDAPENDITPVCFATGQSYPYTQCGPLRAASEMAWDYWHAFSGNVFGVSGVTTSGAGWVYSGSYASNRTQILMMGWNNVNATDTDPNLYPVTNSSWVWIDGNWDYSQGQVTWVSGAHTLPNSLYLTSAPAFFSPGATCTYVWPPVQSTSTPPIKFASGSGCTTYMNPAQARFAAGQPFVSQ
jgi:hypothetical protein